MKRLVALALSSGLLAGCTSTSPIPVDIARKAPAERVSGGPDGQARITVVRDAGLWSSFCTASLYIDGDRVARLEAEEKVTVGVRAGDPVLVRAAQDGGGLCAWLPSSRSLETRLEPGQHRFYRISCPNRQAGPAGGLSLASEGAGFRYIPARAGHLDQRSGQDFSCK